MILDAGTEFDVKRCGLAARDSLKTGAGFPLSHQDSVSWPFHPPWLFAFPFNADQTEFTKHFIVDNTLLKLKAPAITYAIVGHDLCKVAIHEPAVLLTVNSFQTGVVLTCVTEMGIARFGKQI
jgi:aminomethyltransferase